MANTHEPTKKQKFVEGFSSFLNHNKLGILIFAVLLVAVIVGLGVYGSFKNRQLEKSAALMEALQDDYTAKWLSAEKNDASAEIKTELISRAQEIMDKYPGYFAAQRALMMLGNIAYEDSNWDEASGYFLKLAEQFPKSYLTPVALMSAAAAKEESGKADEAKELYRRVVDTYPEWLQEVLRASFSIGRIAEGQGSFDEARTAYEWVIDKGGEQDPWSMLARSRLLFVNAK